MELSKLETRGEQHLLSSSDAQGLHSLRVVDLTDNLVKYEVCETPLPHCQVRKDMPLYRAGADEVDLEVSWEGNRQSVTCPLAQDTDVAAFSLPGFEESFVYTVPSIQCMLGEKNAFLLPDAMWHQVVEAEEVLTLHLPEDWEGKVMLGTHQVAMSPVKDRYEIGNALRSVSNGPSETALWLSLSNEYHQRLRYDITQVIRQPKFLEPPLQEKDGKLLWQAENNFIGNPNTKFQVTCHPDKDQTVVYQTGCQDQVLEDPLGLENGVYPYKVTVEKKSAFAKAAAVQLVFQGELQVGDPRMQAFQHKEIWVRDALCWSFEEDALQRVSMKLGCGVILDLTYQGMTVASGEMFPAPQYQGTLCYVDEMGRYRFFNRGVSKEYEQINPVNIWVINEHLLILRCCTDDAVYIDRKYSSIVNRNPALTMTKVEQRDRLLTPDYFEYRTREV